MEWNGLSDNGRDGGRPSRPAWVKVVVGLGVGLALLLVVLIVMLAKVLRAADAEPVIASGQAPVAAASVTLSPAPTSTQPPLYLVEPFGTSKAITGYNGTESVLTIPATVDGERITAIAEDAFSGHAELTSVTIREGIETVCDGAFRDCAALTTVRIPQSVTELGEHVFSGCTALRNVTGGVWLDAYEELLKTDVYLDADSPNSRPITLYYGESEAIREADFRIPLGGRKVTWESEEASYADVEDDRIVASPWQWDITKGWQKTDIVGRVENSSIELVYRVSVGDGVTYRLSVAPSVTQFVTTEAYPMCITPEVKNCYGIYYYVANEVTSGDPFGVKWQFMVRSPKWERLATMMIEPNTQKLYDPIEFVIPRTFSQYITIANVLRNNFWSGLVDTSIVSLKFAP